jgi:hypothetical protein
MPFDLHKFEAELALGQVPTEQLPLLAQDALEVGFDGPHVVRMAILDPKHGWAIDQALPPMLVELGLLSISPTEAALRLAREHARQILVTGEDPLLSAPYFYRLWVAAGYPMELIDVGNFDDYDAYCSDDREKRAMAHEAVEELLAPELREQRAAERKARWEQEQARIKQEWPYVLNSPSGHSLLKRRYVERVIELRPLLWIEAVAWVLLSWGIGSWRTAVIGYVVTLAVLFTLPVLGIYRQMKRERRDILLRRGVPDDQI